MSFDGGSFILLWILRSSVLNCQVQEHIFAETNRLTKSIQIFLDVLNELRLYYILEGSASASVLSKRECSKVSLLNSPCLICLSFWPSVYRQ